MALDTPEALKSRVGGDVIVLRTQDAQQLSRSISSRFGVTGHSDGQYRENRAA